MNADFWITAWEEGRTNFNQKSFNSKLLQYFPGFNPSPEEKVLVPLCGKTIDLLWLKTLKLRITGVELYQKAVQEFFAENNLQVSINDEPHYRTYRHHEITIKCGDYFKLGQKNEYDFVYDRAALVALPESMREEYVRVTAEALKPGGKYLLLVYEYDQARLEGPPFSINEAEVHQLYQKDFFITLMESQRPQNEGQRLAETVSLTQKVYVLQKKV